MWCPVEETKRFWNYSSNEEQKQTQRIVTRALLYTGRVTKVGVWGGDKLEQGTEGVVFVKTR